MKISWEMDRLPAVKKWPASHDKAVCIALQIRGSQSPLPCPPPTRPKDGPLFKRHT